MFRGGTTLSRSLCLSVDEAFWSSRCARLKCLAGEDTGIESERAVPPLPVGSQ